MKARLKILYVESDQAIRDSIEKFIQLMLHVTIVGIKSDDEAIQYLQNNDDVNLIITEMHSQDVNGMKIIDFLRENSLDIPLIITDEFEEGEELSQALEDIVSILVPKPFNIQKLVHTIEESLFLKSS